MSNKIGIYQFPVEAIYGGTPSVSIDQLAISAIYGGTPPVSINQLPITVIYGGTPPVSIDQFVITVIYNPEVSYTGSGSIIIDSAAITHIGTRTYSEIGSIVIDGEVSVTIHQEVGCVIIDGDTVADPQIAVDLVVTQTIGEILVTQNAQIDFTQTIADVLVSENSKIDVTQVFAEILVTNWRRSTTRFGDFWIVLMRIANSQKATARGTV